MRFLSPLVLLALAHVYVGSRLLPDLPLGGAGVTIGVLLLILSFAAVPAGFMARSLEPRQWADRLAAVSLFTMGFFSSLFVFTVLRDVTLLVATLVLTAGQLSAAQALSAKLVLAIATAATLLGLLNARRRARVTCRSVICRRPCRASPSRRSAMCTWGRRSSGVMSTRSSTR
jgi:hypothetical protein